ncbi:1-hydroxycarotenoid 3,4-desaturase CrtD [Flavobacterium luteum]|uniref:Phytoene desaturase n=1 Tax=Flavobacterium luteum TaxID=2026654 RepID=A0A7J5ADQ7_9FLAO|nr:1-hydroxycarotenoid 3,4-desaturase CrtD [Flavobacterium luteum]KAB1155717.1 phytoene desaturase [Flavobacterium luteum]
MKQNVGIIGAGIGGLALAIRLAKKGFNVTVFEKNSYPGGKLSELKINGFRFDKGPSLLTMPNLIEELSNSNDSQRKFEYKKLDTITHYFYSDGTQLKASSNVDDFAEEVHLKLNEKKESVLKHIKRNAFYFKTTEDLFLKQSLHQIRNFINFKTIKGILCAPFLGLFSTMHNKNNKIFVNPKTVQLFNRYATYNGSNPYKAPALMNMISHLEINLGAYLPVKGMHQITTHLVNLAKDSGVTINYNSLVETLLVESNNTISSIKTNGLSYSFDIVASDVDIHVLYNHLLPKKFTPKKLMAQQKSSSAFVFYWGINKEFPSLGLHNILFSEDYKKEFDYLFSKQYPTEDPTVYINITSKYCKEDAPNGCENWFVMVNVPHNSSASIGYASDLRKNVIAKINSMLKTDIEQHIIAESSLSPLDIENQTSSLGGSLYGNASNNKFAAFLRHSNYSSSIKNLYLVGGSVHPGGGIPLCLLSAKITSNLITKRAN